MPESLQQVLERLQAQALPLLAGGTDFYPALQDRQPPPAVIDITRIPGLRGISRTDVAPAVTAERPTGAAAGSVWRIGAATTWTDLLQADLPKAFAGLKAAAREVGSVQIQNRGTLVGNLCTASPAADGVPALLVLDARVELTSLAGVRELPLDEFILGPRQTARAAGEIVTAIIVPSVDPSACSGFCKLGARRYLVISIAMVAMLLQTSQRGDIECVRGAAGACSPVARRLRSIEAALAALPLADCDGPVARQALIDAAITQQRLVELAPIDDIRAPAAYRMDVVVQLLRRLAGRLSTPVENR